MVTRIKSNQITDGTVVNADINASAAIATSKITGLATSATTDTTNAANIGSGILPDGRFPSTLLYVDFRMESATSLDRKT